MCTRQSISRSIQCCFMQIKFVQCFFSILSPIGSCHFHYFYRQSLIGFIEIDFQNRTIRQCDGIVCQPVDHHWCKASMDSRRCQHLTMLLSIIALAKTRILIGSPRCTTDYDV